MGEYISLRFLGHTLRWLGYITPLVIIQSICLFLILSSLKVSGYRTKAFLRWVSPLTFSVYLIDDNPYFYNKLLKGSFSGFNQLHPLVGIVLLLIISLVMFFTFALFDYIRVWSVIHWKKYVLKEAEK